MSFSTLPPDSRTLVSKLKTKLALIWKEDFGPLDNSPVLLILSPGKTPLTTTVAKFLDTSVCGGSWCLEPSLSPLLVMFTQKFLNWFCLTILIRLRFSRLVAHLFLPHFFLPLNILLTCFDTALCEQPASLAMNVCGLPSLWRVSMIVFWTTVRSAVFPMIVWPIVNQIERLSTIQIVNHTIDNLYIVIPYLLVLFIIRFIVCFLFCHCHCVALR